MTIYAVDSRHPFNHKGNKVDSTVQNVWTVVGTDTVERAVNVAGIGWSGDQTDKLHLRDKDGHKFYFKISGSAPDVDRFSTPLPVMAPFSYFDSAGSNTLIIYGTYA